jgi:hypothetical protein
MGGVKFKLKFPVAELKGWSLKYPYNDSVLEDLIIEEIVPKVKLTGFLTKTDFLEVCKWKTNRTKSRCDKNDADYIKEITSIALHTNSERLRIESLTLLNGVQFPTASVFLHFFHLEKYPIIDFRALYSLGVDEPPLKYTFEFWWEYVTICRELSKESILDMRTVDRALWAFSNENQ